MLYVKRDLFHVFVTIGILGALLAALAVLDARTGVVQDIGGHLFLWLVG